MRRIGTVVAALGVAALLFTGWVSVSGESAGGHTAYQGKAPWGSVEGAGT